jgi:dolichol-phosphate mannosyltransferase
MAEAHRLSLEMLIVDDQSDDGTKEVVASLGEGDWVRLVVRQGPRNLSWAVIDGLRLATNEVFVVMDADLSHPPEAIPRLIGALAEPGVDFVFGSRHVEGSSTDQRWSVLRRADSMVARLLAMPLTRVRDPTSGFVAVRRETFRRARDLNPTGYKIGLELVVKCGCTNIREVPIHFSQRLHGTTKLGLRQRLQYLRHLKRLMVYRLRQRVEP